MTERELPVLLVLPDGRKFLDVSSWSEWDLHRELCPECDPVGCGCCSSTCKVGGHLEGAAYGLSYAEGPTPEGPPVYREVKLTEAGAELLERLQEPQK